MAGMLWHTRHRRRRWERVNMPSNGRWRDAGGRQATGSHRWCGVMIDGLRVVVVGRLCFVSRVVGRVLACSIPG
jgi:hypothetical protein